MSRASIAVAITILLSVSLQAEVVIETVPVGNPGNPDDTHLEGYGRVDYIYNLATFELTAGQYTEFLNAVAATDTYGLYHTFMWLDDWNCKIERSGGPGTYTYTVAPDRANRPVTQVSWGDAARFCNWLHNGQPTGAQDLSTTEDGSYFLNGATTDEQLIAVTREPGATWVIPSEDEWYKAAYHANDGASGNYFDYPTSTDSIPSNDLIDPDPGNNANFRVGEDYTIGSPYWRTEVGEFENSASPYGTFDQGGNVWEWNEGIAFDSSRGNRGGAFDQDEAALQAYYRSHSSPMTEGYFLGFRVAEITPTIPAVSTWGLVILTLFVLAAATLFLRNRPRVAP